MACRKARARKGKAGTQSECGTCTHRMPDAPEDPELGRIIECFTVCSSQVKFAEGIPVALEWNVILEAAKAWGIRVDQRFLRLLSAFERQALSSISKKG